MHRSLLVLLLLVFLVGCGPRNPLGRQAVIGRVTLDGTPLDQGVISFNPMAAHGVVSGATIREGRFAISAQKGLPPGKYAVQINSIRSVAPHHADGTPLPDTGPGVERIAAVYNAASTVTVEVVAGQPADFQFDVKSK